MIFTAVSLLILLYGCFNYRKALMLFSCYYLFWYSTVVFTIGGMAMNTTIVVCGGFVILYIWKYKIKKSEKNPTPFPFKFPFILIFLSYFFSSFSALSGFGTEFARGLRLVLLPYAIIWLLWEVAYTKEDYEFIFKGITIIMLFACIFGLLEYATKNNLLINYKVYLSGDSLVLYDINTLRGYRLYSIFEHPIGGGMTYGLYFAFVFTVTSKNDVEVPCKKMAIFTAILCLPCVVLTKMRSAILFTILCSLTMLDLKKMNPKRLRMLLGMAFFGMPFFLLLMRNNIYIITSLISVNKSATAGGSSLSMRLEQLEAIKIIASSSPVFGLGDTFRQFINRSSYTDAALGFESVWFEQLAMHGVFGVVAQGSLFVYSVFKIPKKYNSRSAFYFALAYWITYTFTSIPSFRLVTFFLALFYFLLTENKEEKALIETDRINDNNACNKV